jgi:hypothetical protein
MRFVDELIIINPDELGGIGCNLVNPKFENN